MLTTTRRIEVCRETWFLFGICCLDMLSSAFFFHHGMASEANPVLRRAAEAGTLPFLAVKSAMFIPALTFAEWYRRRNPRLVQNVLRCTAAAYLLVYSLLVARQFIP